MVRTLLPMLLVSGMFLSVGISNVGWTNEVEAPAEKCDAKCADSKLADKCKDAKCVACEAGTCTDENCQAKKCAEGKCEDSKVAVNAPSKCAKCEAGTCDGSCKAAALVKQESSESEPDVSSALSEARLATPTHRQVKIIKANLDDLEQTKLNCFCTTKSGHILAGCGSSADDGEIRVFDSEGEYVESWSTPVKVEAVNVRAEDGHVFVAGNGRLVELDKTGALVRDEESPHATIDEEQLEEIRETVIQQMAERTNMYKRQMEIYDNQIEKIGEQITKMQDQLAKISADTEGNDTEATSSDEEEDAEGESEEDAKLATRRKRLERQIKQLERSQTSLTRTRELWSDRIEKLGDAEPSEEDIQQQVKSQMARKMGVASISAVDDKVYIACSAAVGYGYSVWSIEGDFADGKEIITDLRGCCGQMDVQACDKGIYVAENSRDRVVCFDHEGEEVCHWGHSAREGIRGFGSCCNPMNVAFGPNSTVYTAESGSGRIKQYSSDGELLQVVGSADLVPGCKKVSIGVSDDGSRVFMLDITRDHIVMMDAIPAEERQQMIAEAAGTDADAEEQTTDAQPASEEKQASAAKSKSKSTVAALGRVFRSTFAGN